eukprot:CAMPEP_0182532154 /NCGR_PEP_ID=MMETSP1323-20130603/10985_1 /TAXON_ID=236787 /ORGANISM="Florenciella parvula, Strain RCC1693" /LENGTH=38 /DNA_ID= /DNA_START= /DNA_END= /DNA_ORIENTATION=
MSMPPWFVRPTPPSHAATNGKGTRAHFFVVVAGVVWLP